MFTFAMTAALASSASLNLQTVATAAPPAPRAVSFQELASYEFEVPEMKVTPEKPLPAIPDSIKSLSGKIVRVSGFMIPLKFSGGKVSEFLLTSMPFGCCYGGIPQVNEMMEVAMPKGKGTGALNDTIIEVTGKLTVKVKTDAQGYLLSVYQLEGESVEVKSSLPHQTQY